MNSNAKPNRFAVLLNKLYWGAASLNVAFRHIKANDTMPWQMERTMNYANYEVTITEDVMFRPTGNPFNQIAQEANTVIRQFTFDQVFPEVHPATLTVMQEYVRTYGATLRFTGAKSITLTSDKSNELNLLAILMYITKTFGWSMRDCIIQLQPSDHDVCTLARKKPSGVDSIFGQIPNSDRSDLGAYTYNSDADRLADPNPWPNNQYNQR